jgi:hypothetical protein
MLVRSRRKHYPKLSNDVNITRVRKPIVNDELLKIANMTVDTRNTK